MHKEMRRGSFSLIFLALGAGFSAMACTGVFGEPEGTPDEEQSAAGPGATGSSSGAQGASSSSGSAGGGVGGMQGMGGAGGAGTGGSMGTSSSSSSGASSSSSSSSSSGSPVDAVCMKWNADRANLSEGTWSGNVAACNPGDISADGRQNALKLVNLYRFLAGLPPVATDPTRNQKAQACALMMDANNSLSHSPPMNWACYTADGAQAAGNSNIASGPGVMAVDMYMADFGNETTMGHRRWILSGSLGPIGLGSSDSYSCMWVIGGNGNQNPAYTAWPPGGPFPAEALNASFVPIDQSGWSIQSSVINLSNAQVTIMDGGQNMPVTVTQLLANYGSQWAIRMVPNGWTSQIGHTYSVSVSGVAQAIQYDVQIVNCN